MQNKRAPIAREHHYVPRFLMRPWARQGELHGYYWDVFRSKVRVKKRGVSAFCKEVDLLSLEAAGLRSDALETDFFGNIDAQGASASAVLVEAGPNALTETQRTEFARLILSLDARRPQNIAKLRHMGSEAQEAFDNDPEVINFLRSQGNSKKPSNVQERITGASFENHAMLVIQRVIDNPTVGRRLINAHWRVYSLRLGDGSFVLGDRPLYRSHSFDAETCVWALPITPRNIFVAANSKYVIDKFDRSTPLRLRKLSNMSSITQADRYVFLADEENLSLVYKRLVRPKA